MAGDAPNRTVHAREQTHQRGLARAVRTHQADAVAALDHQVHVVEDDVVAVSLAHALQLQYHAARLGRVGELEADLLAHGRDLDPLDLVQHLDAALDLARLGGL